MSGNRLFTAGIFLNTSCSGYPDLQLFFPYSKHGMIWKLFISGDMSDTSVIIILGLVCAVVILDIYAVIIQFLCPVCRICFPRSRFSSSCRRICTLADFYTRPSKEFISSSLRCSRNFNSFIDLQIIILLECVFTSILIPVNMCRRRLLCIDIYSLEFYSIFLCLS